MRESKFSAFKISEFKIPISAQYHPIQYTRVVHFCGSGAKFGSLAKFIWLLCILLCVMHFGSGG